jgi:predicted negative regulator of RcsB-dependent stress response
MTVRDFVPRTARRLLEPWLPRRWRWSAPLEDADRLAQFSAIASQLELSYIDADQSRFDQLRSAALELLPALHPVRRQRYGFLLQVLNANILLQQGDEATAAASYRTAIQEVEACRRNTVRRGADDQDARNLDFLSTVLALLHNNLGEILSRDAEAAAQAEQEFRNASALQPAMTYIRQRLAEHYVRRRNWEAAAEAFRDIYRCAPSEEGDKRLLENLTYVKCEEAQRLKEDGRAGQAVTALTDARIQILGKGHAGWEGRIHYLRGECYAQLSRANEALDDYATSRARYADAKYLPSASFVAETAGDLLVNLRRDDDASEAYSAAMVYAERITTDGEHGEGAQTTRRRRARLLAKRALLDLAAGRRQPAQAALASALELVPAEEQWNPYDRVVSQLGSLLERDDLLAILKVYYTDLLSATADPRTRRELIDALRSLYERSERLVTEDYQTTVQAEQGPMLNVVTPIALEVDEATLVRSGGHQRIIDDLAPAMRKRIQDTYGVPIPGLRIRANADELGEGTYVILINEIPRETGTVRADGLAYLGPAAALQGLGVAATEEISTRFLAEGAWVTREGADRLARAGHTLWDPLEYMVRHVEALLTENLIEFIGHQEVQNLLERAGLIATERPDEMLQRESARHIDALSNVVRCLVAERVPIGQFADVHRLFLDGEARGLATYQIVEEIRGADFIKPHLWGNDGSYQLFQLGPGIARSIDLARRGSEAGGRVLAMEPQLVQDILGAVRAAVGDVRRPAVVVPGSGRAALARSLVEIEFPNLPVLSLRELRPGLGLHRVGTIDLPATPAVQTR